MDEHEERIAGGRAAVVTVEGSRKRDQPGSGGVTKGINYTNEIVSPVARPAQLFGSRHIPISHQVTYTRYMHDNRTPRSKMYIQIMHILGGKRLEKQSKANQLRR